MGVRGEFVEGSLYLHLHGLRREVAGFHILTDLQQLVGDFPGVDLEGKRGGGVSERAGEVPAGLRESLSSPKRKRILSPETPP